MVLRIRSHDGPNLTILLPTGLVFNGITAEIAARATRSTAAPMNAAQLRRLFAAIRHDKKRHPGWVLVDVHSADGTEVFIKP